MLPIQRPEAAWAVRILMDCARLAQQIQAETRIDAIKKVDRTPVTIADFSIQAVVAGSLHAAFPQDVLVGEEKAEFLRTPEGAATLDAVTARVNTLVDAAPDKVCRWIDRGAAQPVERYWTLDPVDGTKGFLRGEHYAVALALIENKEVTLGLLACPRWSLPSCGGGTLAIAAKHEGAWACPLSNPDQWQRLCVNRNDTFGSARLLRSVEKEHTDVSHTDRLMAKLGMSADSIPMDSAAKYAVLAAGEGDIFVRIPAQNKPVYREKIWDMAAGALLVAEAGGRITDIDGLPLDFFGARALERNRGMLATNGLLHAQVLEALRALKV